MQRAQTAFSILTRGPALPAASRFVANGLPPRAASTFDAAWHSLLGAYLRRTPSAASAVVLLRGMGCHVHNDHVAMRAFVDSRGTSGLAFLDAAFTAFGYAPQDKVAIPSLPVNARWYEPPAAAESWPKIFVSELRTSELPDAAARATIYEHVDGYYDGAGDAALRAALAADDSDALFTLLDEPPWAPSAADVAAVRGSDGGDPAMRAATEYAAWTLTHGHRINHLTILQNALELQALTDLRTLNALLVSEGYAFNLAGGTDGLTQGSAAAHLEQSSTRADVVPHTFGCGTVAEVPCAFLELIQRHEGFRGFLGQNAKGIFASTHAQ